VEVAGQLDLGIGEHPPDTQILLDLDDVCRPQRRGASFDGYL